MFNTSFCNICFLLILLLCVNTTLALSWQDFATPINEKPDAIGAYNNGCLFGAEPLPESGKGFQVIRTSRNRFYGHPNLINFIKNLASTTKEKGLNDLLIADMSMPRGGSFKSGHASHQTGLDVDIWLRTANEPLSLQAREAVPFLDVVDKNQFKINRKKWSLDHVTLIQEAAKNAQVARIFVNPVIKQQLCNMQFDDESWLSKVRPWWGHTYHMHVRLSCPKENIHCQNQKQVTSVNGCNELTWWRKKFTTPVKKMTSKPVKKRVKIKPEQCQALLANK